MVKKSKLKIGLQENDVPITWNEQIPEDVQIVDESDCHNRIVCRQSENWE